MLIAQSVNIVTVTAATMELTETEIWMEHMSAELDGTAQINGPSLET